MGSSPDSGFDYRECSGFDGIGMHRRLRSVLPNGSGFPFVFFVLFVVPFPLQRRTGQRTNRLMPSLSRATLKFISRPILIPASFM